MLVSVNASNSIILCRQIKDKKSWKPIGYLVMRIDENRVSEVFEDTLSQIDARSMQRYRIIPVKVIQYILYDIGIRYLHTVRNNLLHLTSV